MTFVSIVAIALLTVVACSFVVNVRSAKDLKYWAIGPADKIKRKQKGPH